MKTETIAQPDREFVNREVARDLMAGSAGCDIELISRSCKPTFKLALLDEEGHMSSIVAAEYERTIQEFWSTCSSVPAPAPRPQPTER